MMGLLNPIHSSHDLQEMGCNTRIAGDVSGTNPSLVFLHMLHLHIQRPFVQQRSGPREAYAAGGIMAYGRGLLCLTVQLRV